MNSNEIQPYSLGFTSGNHCCQNSISKRPSSESGIFLISEAIQPTLVTFGFFRSISLKKSSSSCSSASRSACVSFALRSASSWRNFAISPAGAMFILSPQTELCLSVFVRIRREQTICLLSFCQKLLKKVRTHWVMGEHTRP